MTGITLLAEFGLPSGTVYLSDGGVTDFGGNTYTPSNATLGSLAYIENMNEGSGNEVQSLEIGFAAPGITTIASLSNGALQKGAVKLSIAVYDEMTGAVIGTPEQRFFGVMDQPEIAASQRELSITITAVPRLEYMFAKRDGNGLSSVFHKGLYSGELGHDEATGLGVTVAWGTESGSGGYSGGSGGGGANGSPSFPRMIDRL